jgi:tetratricopeptide (TPR) repeat protein
MTDATSTRTRSAAQTAGVIIRLAATGAVLIGLGLTAIPTGLDGGRVSAQAALESGEPSRAAAIYRQMAAYEPWVEQHLVAAIGAAVQAGDYEGAARDLAGLEAQRPLTGEEMLWRGAILSGQGLREEALRVWEEAWRAGAVDQAGLAALAREYLATGAGPQARAALEALQQQGTHDAELLYRLGLLQALDAPEAAVITLAQVAQLDPVRAPVLAPLLDALDDRSAEPPEQNDTRLGVAYLALGELELAEAVLSRAVAANPTYGEALAYLAFVRARLGHPALGAAQQAVALAPDSAVVHVLAGLTWEEHNRPHDARIAFERALALDRANPAIAAWIAGTHRAEGQFHLAELWMQEAARLAGDDYAYRLLVAQFYVDAEYRVSEEGIPRARALVAEQPEDAEAHATLGWGYFLTGDMDGAFGEIDAALALDPDLPRANAHKGALLESQGRLSESVAYYQRAAQLDPGGHFGLLARRALERITSQP